MVGVLGQGMSFFYTLMFRIYGVMEHCATHWPQEMHFSSTMFAWPAWTSMAFVGHARTHE